MLLIVSNVTAVIERFTKRRRKADAKLNQEGMIERRPYDGLDMFGGGFADPVASDRVQVRAHDKPPFRPSQEVATSRKRIVARLGTSCQTQS
jgi:hypothetical protein